MDACFLGWVYAVDEKHKSLSLQSNLTGALNCLVEPEVWSQERFNLWLEKHQLVAVRGMAANGMPLLMRAELMPITFE